jgi:hypothetical protein
MVFRDPRKTAYSSAAPDPTRRGMKNKIQAHMPHFLAT